MIKASELVALMKKMKDFGDPHEIRFGDVNDPQGRHDAIIVRWQPTAGGMQYSCRTVNLIGQEGSGIYDPDPVNIAHEALKMAEKHTAPHPNPAIRELMKNRPKLSFYLIS